MKASQAPPLLRIGCGAGFSGDRWDAAVPVVRTLAAAGGPAVLMYETLAERTLALAQLQRRQQPDAGFEPSLERFVRPVLADCLAAGIPIVGNFGAANPAGAAACLQRLGGELGLGSLRIAIVEGDDLLGGLSPERLREVLPPAVAGQTLVSANAYLGAQEIAGALRAGAQVVVTGRVADPALALGPMLAHFGWREDDWDRLACGTMAGHLLECGAQVTGGYFADPGFKDVPDVAHVGFPIVEMHADGRFVVTKAQGTGGCVDRRTVTEQILYEVHDPAAYLTPDVVADISQAELHEDGTDRIEVRGVRGHPRPTTLKATVCYEGGWLAEGEISYAGANAAARARLAGEIVRERLRVPGLQHLKLRCDLIGVASVFADDAGRWWEGRGPAACEDVRLRVAAATAVRAEAEQVTRELTALYTCGPAAGGGVRSAITPRLHSDSCYVPREWLRTGWRWAP
ncbi:acyclic terpene utilization AtuA family protein [Ramlibacter sp. AN1133]|uniref:acyclic terpene utilization AtuA family protein n=1 Tax=Ramlibacter sp. AN1133 TaxID=3133429 RepID=UPI0030C16295